MFGRASMSLKVVTWAFLWTDLPSTWIFSFCFSSTFLTHTCWIMNTFCGCLWLFISGSESWTNNWHCLFTQEQRPQLPLLNNWIVPALVLCIPVSLVFKILLAVFQFLLPPHKQIYRISFQCSVTLRKVLSKCIQGALRLRKVWI